MRTRAALTGIFASIGILVVGWQVGAAATTAGSTTTTTTNAVTGTGTTGSTQTTTDTTSTTYTGDTETTRFGDVQVSITVADGTITDVTALHLTDAEGRSVQISNNAAPILRSEVLESQSANVAGVSGATYTSEAYLASLQSAIDKAGL